MKGLIFLSIFWTDLVKTIPVDDKNMYKTFLSTESKLGNCPNYNVSVLKSESFKGLCSLPSPNTEDYAQSKEKIFQAMKFNLTPLLCYTIFHNVYAVCHPDTKISSKLDLKKSKSSDKFCESITPISLPETCTEWLEDDDHKSKSDCFLVNEVVGAVLNNQDFCKNKCLVPDPNEDSLPSINPLCERLLETSNILVQVSSKDVPDVKSVSPSTSSREIQPPPGLKKVTESAKVETGIKEGEEEIKDLEPKSGDLTPQQEQKAEAKEDETEKELSEPEGKEKNDNGDIDAEPLVSNEEKDKPDKAIEDVKDVEETVKEVTKSQVMPVLPDAEKEIVETKYENNMKPGPEIDEHSSFFGYFILLSIVAIIAYLVFHNKQKILALVLEGRRRQGNRRRSGGREYRKLDSNLEDTMDPGKETSLRQVIY